MITSAAPMESASGTYSEVPASARSSQAAISASTAPPMRPRPTIQIFSMRLPPQNRQRALERGAVLFVHFAQRQAIAAHVHAQQVHGFLDGDGVHLDE